MRRLSSLVVVFCIFALVLTLAGAASAGDERKVKSQVAPQYPELARTMHLQGTVKVEITIAPNGTVSKAKVVGGHPVLAAAAVNAVEKWRYEAGPEETRVVKFDFNGN